MPTVLLPPATAHELAVAERSATLGQLLADNKHETYIRALLPSWFVAAPAYVRDALRDSMQQLHATQTVVSAVFARITPLEQFAEPLLKTALNAHGHWEVNPRAHGFKEVHLLSNVLIFIANQQLQLVDPLIRLLFAGIGVPQSLELNLVSSITQQSLLQAAMQNFELAQTRPGSFAAGTMVYGVSGGQQLPLATLTPEKFAGICRDLNLGMQYQRHLASVFEPPDDALPVADPQSKTGIINTAFSHNKRHEFAVALHIAYMKSEVSAYHYSLMVNLLLPLTNSTSNSPVLHSTLSILDFELPGIILFWPERKPVQESQSCVVYLPNGPQKTFYEFATFDLFKVQLREWLKSSLFADYFVKRVPLRHRPEFVRRTNIKQMTWDSLLLRRPPVINEPALMTVTAHKPQTASPFDVAWQLQLAQIKDDARQLMVPTGDEDTKNRLERQAMYLNLGMSLLGLALGFVPVLGEILLASSVLQLGTDVYEGIEAWQHHDRVAALEHLFDLAQNIALAAGTGGVAGALKAEPVVDALVPVKTVKGHKRLWKPDLGPYEHKHVSLAGLVPDEQGLYRVDDQHYIRLDGKVLEVRIDPDKGHSHALHPTAPDAYTPRLFHNGRGVWTHELDNEMPGTALQLLRRFGAAGEGISDTGAELALTASNISDAVLRRVLMDNLAPPPLLLDSLKRVRLSERIEAFIASVHPQAANRAEFADLQLELLTLLPGWPDDRVLRVVDASGLTFTEYGMDLQAAHPRLQVAQAQINKGDLLKVTLECLSETQIDALLGEHLPTLEQQVQALVRKLAAQAEATKQPLLARLYGAGEIITEDVSHLKNQFPSLPVAVINELLEHLTPAQRLQMTSTGAVPLQVLEEARCYAQGLRLNRAIEGVFHQALSSAESTRVGFGMLPELQGWRDTLGFVIRDKSNGQVLDSVGSAPGSRREIYKSADLYEFHATTGQVYSSPYLLNCVENALTAAERSALGLAGHDPGAQLRFKVASLAAQHRAKVANILGMHRIKPWFKSPMRLADGRRGYTLGGRSGRVLPPAAPRLKDLVLELYPTMNEVQAGQFLYQLKLPVPVITRALMNLKAELTTLRSDLEQWAASSVWTQPRSGPRSQLSPQVKQDISRALICAWRRQTPSVTIEGHLGYELDLNAWPVDSLPVLTANFDHISVLHLSNSSSGHFPAGFLNRLPNLRILSLKSSQLVELPVAIASMAQLRVLNLQGNRIALSDETVATLSGLTHLRSLNLTGNTLGRRIDVRRMGELKHLLLRHTGVADWPLGVEFLAHLRTLDLRDNAITHIPDEVFAADHAALNRVTYLHDNPLSADSLRRLQIYSRENGISLGVELQRQHIALPGGIRNWSALPNREQATYWSGLLSYPRADDFFRVLDDLSASEQFVRQPEDLTRRVWTLLQGMHDNRELRRRVLDIAADPRTCADGIAMIFADMELQQQVFIAHTRHNTEESLLQLARGLFRIELLNRHVNSVIEERLAAITVQQQDYVQQLQDLVDTAGADFTTAPLSGMDAAQQQGVAYRLGTPEALELARLISPEGVRSQIAELDPLQVQMFYHVKLAEPLGLPARPKSMRFERIAQVSPADLDAAKTYVLTQDQPLAMQASLENRDFWMEFLEKKYPEAFTDSDKPQHERMAVLYMARENMGSNDYVQQSNALGNARKEARAQLISRLTRQELEQHPLAN